MSRRWRIAVTFLGVLIVVAGAILALVRHAQSEARGLLQAIVSLEVGKSTVADVQRLQQRFRWYQTASEQSGEEHFVSFLITNQPLAALKLQPPTALSAALGMKNGKMVWVEVVLERQVGAGSRAVMTLESLRHTRLSCTEPYCVGNPIGKPFIITRLDARATPEQKRRAFDLDLNWLTRFRGEPRVCDLSQSAWEDWKAQLPNYIAALQATYDCQ